ncbi:ABC-2 type transport system permease protein [Mumia flava]|uniref:ABC-2 type transport system permease protein n=1 Tax=Mumia flava TaxID=1348852 RepID=A0A0B2B6S1_9ACTN|nr:hypothetical protein [Mumia flava]PJJ57694.1 ABC-2 type transport system permease protein [Mumia flava]
MSGRYAGTGVLLRFALRRDRWALLWWILGGFLLYVVTAATVEGTYPTQADLDAAAAAVSGNPAFIAMAGPAYALDTIGGQTAWQTTAFGAIIAGLMSTFLINRHVRAGEEGGQSELIRANVTGRSAPGASALIETTAANLLLGVLVAAGLTAYGLPAAGSVCLGVAVTTTGWTFMGAAFVCAQLSQTTRGVWGMSGAVIGAAYLLRAIGDVGNATFSWLSPIGWGQRMRAYDDERWWPALIGIAAAAILVAIGHALFERRDFGAGLLAVKPGPADARWSSGTTGLAWRLHRPTVIGWGIAFVLTGLSYGSVGDDVDDLIGDASGDLTAALTGGGDQISLVDGFYSSAVIIIAIIAAAYGTSAALRSRGEETSGRLEPVLATAASRTRWLADHVGIALLGSALMVVVGGACTGLSLGLLTDDLDQVWRLGGAGLAAVPAIWVVVGVAVALVGVLPRLSALAWLMVGWGAVVLMFGALLDFPDWVNGISPFDHLALVPAQDYDWTSGLWLLAVTAVLLIVGFVGFRRRDLQT